MVTQEEEVATLALMYGDHTSLYRFESCSDYICITDWWSDLYGPNYLWG